LRCILYVPITFSQQHVEATVVDILWLKLLDNVAPNAFRVDLQLNCETVDGYD
jgi:hypothetical protein